MKDVVEKDTTVVNLIAVLAIFVVLLVTFRSVSLPLLFAADHRNLHLDQPLQCPIFFGRRAVLYRLSGHQHGAAGRDGGLRHPAERSHANRQALGAREAMRASPGGDGAVRFSSPAPFWRRRVSPGDRLQRPDHLRAGHPAGQGRGCFPS